MTRRRLRLGRRVWLAAALAATTGCSGSVQCGPCGPPVRTSVSGAALRGVAGPVEVTVCRGRDMCASVVVAPRPEGPGPGASTSAPAPALCSVRDVRGIGAAGDVTCSTFDDVLQVYWPDAADEARDDQSVTARLTPADPSAPAGRARMRFRAGTGPCGCDSLTADVRLV